MVSSIQSGASIVRLACMEYTKGKIFVLRHAISLVFSGAAVCGFNSVQFSSVFSAAVCGFSSVIFSLRDAGSRHTVLICTDVLHGQGRARTDLDRCCAERDFRLRQS